MNKRLYKLAGKIEVGDEASRAPLMALAHFSNGQGETGIRTSKLSAHLGITEDDVRRHLLTLEARGLIAPREGRRGVVYQVLPQSISQ